MPGSIRASAWLEFSGLRGLIMSILEQTPTSAAVLVDEHGLTPRGPIAIAWTFLQRQPVGAIGMVLVLVFGLAGIFAEWIAPYSPTANDFAVMTEPPGWSHWLGTDQLGRDLLSRILFGARTAFIVGMTSALVGGISGLVIGVVPYVDAARALGYGHMRIIMRHMVPNVMGPFLVIITAFVGQAILAEAALSYLGLGVQEPVPAWGLMLQGGAEEYATTAPWIAVFPGLAIMLTVFGINLFGDSLRDVLDPKMRDR